MAIVINMHHHTLWGVGWTINRARLYQTCSESIDDYEQKKREWRVCVNVSSKIFSCSPSAGTRRELCRSKLRLKEELSLCRSWERVRRSGQGRIKGLQWKMEFSSREFLIGRPQLKCAVKWETSLWQQTRGPFKICTAFELRDQKWA